MLLQMKSMNRIYAVAVVAIFLLSMLGPLGVYLFSQDKTISVAEKRELETFPEIGWDYERIIAFPKKFDSYYQDHFGFRDALVTFHNATNLNIFGVTAAPLVMKGKENWFFLTEPGVIQDFYGMRQVGPQVLDDYAQVLLERQDWLNSMGIRYLFLPVPNKINIYPEKLPGRIQQMSGPTLVEQLSTYLRKTVKDVVFVDLSTLLLQAKQDYQVYRRTDTHWSNQGALVAFNQIIRKLKTWFPAAEEIADSELMFSEIEHSGDLAYLMHLENKVKEVATVVSVKNPCSRVDQYRRVTGELYETLVYKGPATAPLETGCENRELTVLLIQDSFGSGLRPYLDERFKRVFYSEKFDFNELKEFIVALRPDVVIDERVARNLTLALRHDRELETRLLKKQFDQAGLVVFDLSSDDEQNTIVAQFDVAVSKQKDGYALLPESNDPYVTIPLDTVKTGGRYNALIELSAPKDTVLEIFYKPAGTAQYQADYSIARNIKKGYNRLYLRFPDMDIENEIRLDPGRIRVDPRGQAKPYILHSFTVKARR